MTHEGSYSHLPKRLQVSLLDGLEVLVLIAFTEFCSFVMQVGNFRYTFLWKVSSLRNAISLLSV